MSCDRNICYAQDYNGGCESCPCNPDSKENELEKMSNEEKYKLALFAVIRNSMVMSAGFKLGKSLKEINKMTIATMQEVIDLIDFENLKKVYEEAIDEEYMAVKGKEKIIRPIEKIRREIDMRAFEEMRKEEQ